MFDYCDLYICISMGLVVSLLSCALRKQPRVTSGEISLKCWRHDKEVSECVVESLLHKTISVLGHLY